MTVAEGFGAIVDSCLEHFRMNEQLVVADSNAEALHQARVALRRLRSALSLFKPAIKGPELRRIRAELRAVTRPMGAARNIDVMLAHRADKDPRREKMERDRRRHYAIIARTFGSQSFRDLVLSLIVWAHDGDWRAGRRAKAPLMKFTIRRIDRVWRTCEERGIYLAALSDRQRHRLRIDIKKLRYALEFVDEPLRRTGSGHRKFVRMAEGLQNALGHLNDMATARGHGAIASDAAATASAEAREMRAAGRHFRQLRRIGPYWREAAAG